MYILLFSLIYAEPIPLLSPAILLDSRHQSLFPHTSVIFQSNHSHSFLINILKPYQIHQLPQTKLITNMIASFPPSRLISNLHQTLIFQYQITGSCCWLPTPITLASGGVRFSRLWSNSQLLRISGQQYSHSGGVRPQIQG